MPQKTKLEIKAQSKLLDGLNDEQKQAVTHGQGPLLIVAGAGTGKTTVITRRIAYLIEQGLAKPEEILALAFGEKAAAEMEERVDQLLPYGYYNLQISTFHSFGEHVLREHGIEIGLPDFKVLDEVGQWLLVRNNLDKFNLDYYRPLGNPTRFIKALVSHFARAKDELITPAEYLEYAEKLRLALDNAEAIGNPSRPSATLPSGTPLKSLRDFRGTPTSPGEGNNEALRVAEVANAYHVYQRLLLENNCLDFGDLINYSLDLFKKRPKTLDYYRDKFRYILIDEFQDTNFAQYELVKLLAAPRNNITVVGDDDQSIYKFRGASISNILHFQRDFKSAKFISLVKNYRSGQKILDQAYRFIQANNPDRLEVKLKLPKKLAAQNPDPGAVEHHILETYLEEADFVTGKILELLSENPKLTLNDFAILARSHDALTPFISKLEEHNVSYIYFASKGLYAKPIILDLISYFKLLDDYHESAYLYRVLQFPVFNINHKAIIELAHFAKRKSMSLYEALKSAATMSSIEGADLEGVRKVLAFLDKHAQLARKKNVGEVYVEVFNDLGLGQLLANDYQSQRYIAAFNKKIQNFQQESSDKSLRSFLNQLNFELEAGDTGELEFDPEAGPEAVKLTSVHGAKGLEFAYVFAVGMVDKRFPTIERREQIEIPKALIKDILPEGDIHLEEERRLFYVAMTRAKKGLILTRAHDYGGKLTKKPSRFLVELDLAKSETAKPTGQVNLRTVKTKVALPVPKYFSYSQIALFERCPLEYKARYILGIPEKGKGTYSFGLTIHNTFYKFLKLAKQHREAPDLFGKANEELPNLERLLKLYQECWIDDWYYSASEKEKARKKGREICKLFYEDLKGSLPASKYLEQGFKLHIGNYYLRGKIDRADEGNTGLVIIDYKTRKQRENEDKRQLLIYQLAARDFFRENVAELQYWFLQDEIEKMSFLGLEKDLEKLQDQLGAIIDQIVGCTKNDNFYNLDMRISHDCGFRNLLP